MGLDITGFTSELHFHWGYSGLHQVRAIAVQVAKEIPWGEAWKLLTDRANENDPVWKTDYLAWLEAHGLSQFTQLLHFSDAEGLMVKSWVLDGTDTKRSQSLGDLDRLYSELEEIRLALTSQPCKYPGHAEHMDVFWMLYNLVRDEAENGVAIWFH